MTQIDLTDVNHVPYHLQGLKVETMRWCHRVQADG